VIRDTVDVEAMAYIMDVLSAGIVDSSRGAGGTAPPYDVLLDTIAEMLDRMLTPDDGGNLEAGKVILRRLADAAYQQFTQDTLSEQDGDEQ